MYEIEMVGHDGLSGWEPLGDDLASAIEALWTGDFTPCDFALFDGLVKYLRGPIDDHRKPGLRLRCLCHGIGEGVFAELRACRSNLGTPFLRRVDGPINHTSWCVHASDSVDTNWTQPGTEPQTLTFQSFLGVASRMPERPWKGRQSPWQHIRERLHRAPRRTLRALQDLCIATSGLEVLFDSSELPLTGEALGWPAERMTKMIRAALDGCTDEVRLIDFLLIDPPFLDSLIRRLMRMAQREPVVYAHVVVDHIRIDRQIGQTTLSRKEKGKVITLDLPCIVAVTREYLRESAGPFMVTISLRSASGQDPMFHAYARQIVSKRNAVPIDAIAERASAKDLHWWASIASRRGACVRVVRPLKLSADPSGQRYIADFEVWIKVASEWCVAFVEVNGDVGNAYWRAKDGPHAAMQTRGKVIIDDRSERARTNARPALMRNLNQWLRACGA